MLLFGSHRINYYLCKVNKKGGVEMNRYIQLLRPLQWVKNLFVFAPLFFSNSLLDFKLCIKTIFVFWAFCLISSSIYCLNDINDVGSDKIHPYKKKRPIASGKVSIKEGYGIMSLCLFFALFSISLSNIVNQFSVFVVLLIYWCMNVAYCLKLKQFPIVDVIIISLGFVMRVLIGGYATNIWVSHWIILMTFLLSLFLAFAKRYDDYMIYANTGTLHRQSVKGYNLPFLEEVVAILASVIIVCYIMYATSDDVIDRTNNSYLYLTSLWVVIGLIRYLQNMFVYKRVGSPTALIRKDRVIQVCLLGWLLSFVIIIYC